MKKKLIILLIFFAILFIVTSFIPLKSYLKKSESISPNVLYLTQPVNSFLGKVEKIDGNKITVSQKLATSRSSILPPITPPKTINVTYHVTTTDKTLIYQTLPGSLVTAAPKKLTTKDIKVGQTINVNTTKDLRTLIGDTFEATMINLPTITNTLIGKIVSQNDNSITIRALPRDIPLSGSANIVPTVPQEKEYRIIITTQTEISKISYLPPVQPGAMPQLPKKERLSASDLKKDMRVTVYTAQDVNENSQLTALRIESINPIDH